jgi:hypothetical protein
MYALKFSTKSFWGVLSISHLPVGHCGHFKLQKLAGSKEAA